MKPIKNLIWMCVCERERESGTREGGRDRLRVTGPHWMALRPGAAVALSGCPMAALPSREPRTALCSSLLRPGRRLGQSHRPALSQGCGSPAEGGLWSVDGIIPCARGVSAASGVTYTIPRWFSFEPCHNLLSHFSSAVCPFLLSLMSQQRIYQGEEGWGVEGGGVVGQRREVLAFLKKEMVSF